MALPSTNAASDYVYTVTQPKEKMSEGRLKSKIFATMREAYEERTAQKLQGDVDFIERESETGLDSSDLVQTNPDAVRQQEAGKVDSSPHRISRQTRAALIQARESRFAPPVGPTGIPAHLEKLANADVI